MGKTTIIGVNVGFTPAQLASIISDVADNVKDYGFGNTSGLTVKDLYDMSMDGNGFYELERKDRTNTHGDPDYFFETGKFQFKPGMEKGYLKKLGL